MTHNKIEHYTPELAYKKAKESFNWRKYVQPFIDKYVAEAVKEAKMQCVVCIRKPDNYDYDEATNACIKACCDLGWECNKSSNTSGIGYIDVILNWDK